MTRDVIASCAPKTHHDTSRITQELTLEGLDMEAVVLKCFGAILLAIRHHAVSATL